jgi:hypothetical protein
MDALPEFSLAALRATVPHPLALLVGAQRHAILAQLLGKCRGEFDKVHLFASFDETSGRREDPAAEVQLAGLLQDATVHHGVLRAKDVLEIVKRQNKAIEATKAAGTSERNTCLVVLRGFHYGVRFDASPAVSDLIRNHRHAKITVLITTPQFSMASNMLRENGDVYITDAKQAAASCLDDTLRTQLQSALVPAPVVAAAAPPAPEATINEATLTSRSGLYGWLASWVSANPEPTTTAACIEAAPRVVRNVVWCPKPAGDSVSVLTLHTLAADATLPASISIPPVPVAAATAAPVSA